MITVLVLEGVRRRSFEAPVDVVANALEGARRPDLNMGTTVAVLEDVVLLVGDKTSTFRAPSGLAGLEGVRTASLDGVWEADGIRQFFETAEFCLVFACGSGGRAVVGGSNGGRVDARAIFDLDDMRQYCGAYSTFQS